MPSKETKTSINVPKSEFGRLILSMNMPLMISTAVITQYSPKLEPQISNLYETYGKDIINAQINYADSLGKFLKIDDETLDEQL